METSAAIALNNFFQPFDTAILTALNGLAEAAGGFFTPVMRIVTMIGEKGLLFFLLAIFLMLFPRTRKTGVCIFGAVCCGALLTSVILKEAICRLRPFEANEIFRGFWEAVGSPAEDGFSFPSGHVTAAAAGSLALILERGKKYILPGALYVGLMCLSRNYLMAHYPSDVLAGVLVGSLSAVAAFFIAGWIFRLLRQHRRSNPLCYFILYYDPLRVGRFHHNKH
ncbi:MAG: phosphatase PAP2 family protein [Oscillospiraceae bacterium]|nr:phosphatase PAP2 family protein [Oscillospiraceae bacterium]